MHNWEKMRFLSHSDRNWIFSQLGRTNLVTTPCGEFVYVFLQFRFPPLAGPTLPIPYKAISQNFQVYTERILAFSSSSQGILIPTCCKFALYMSFHQTRQFPVSPGVSSTFLLNPLFLSLCTSRAYIFRGCHVTEYHGYSRVSRTTLYVYK